MAKWQNDLMLDAGLGWVANQTDRIFLCAGAPANYTAANTGGANNLGVVNVTPGNGNGAFLLDDGAANGRELNVLAANIANIAANGTANHIVLANSTNSVLTYQTTCTGQTVTTPNPANIGAWLINLNDVTP